MTATSPQIVDEAKRVDVPAFRLRDVSFAYGEDVVALSSISLTIAQGEKIALLGANGSGKSTLLRIMNALIHPATGSMEAFGDLINEQALREEVALFRFRRRVGFIFQNSDAQLFSPTVRDEIAFGPLQLGLTRDVIDGRIIDVASMLDIVRLLDRPPFQLSGGEKKKAAIASVLVTNPDALLLDEPTNGLDPRSQRWLVELLNLLNGAGKTLVVATHDLDLVPEIADTALVMNEDHGIETIGKPNDVLADSETLLKVNLIHEHSHWHNGVRHSHPHYHVDDHSHDHERTSCQ